MLNLTPIAKRVSLLAATAVETKSKNCPSCKGCRTVIRFIDAFSVARPQRSAQDDPQACRCGQVLSYHYVVFSHPGEPGVGA